MAVLVLSQYVEPVYTAEPLATGESGVGYLLKERVSEIRSFVEPVRRVAEGAPRCIGRSWRRWSASATAGAPTASSAS
jgi:hypothetical protein